MNKELLQAKLQIIGLNEDEASVFCALLEGNKTHQQIGEATGINRTTVYRVVDDLAQKGVVHEVTTDEGRHIARADLASIEMLVAEHELELKEKQEALTKILELAPTLQPDESSAFSVKTFYGVSGLKQMLWNELRTKGEIVIFSHYASLDMVAGKRFADKFRSQIIDRGIHQRALCNGKENTIKESAIYESYVRFYDELFIDRQRLPINQEITIHDNTVSIYNWDKEVRVGTEIHNPLYADFMRSIFEKYWDEVSR